MQGVSSSGAISLTARRTFPLGQSPSLWRRKLRHLRRWGSFLHHQVCPRDVGRSLSGSAGTLQTPLSGPSQGAWKVEKPGDPTGLDSDVVLPASGGPLRAWKGSQWVRREQERQAG